MLTPRQLQILVGIANGNDVDTIARKLDVHPGTVKQHKKLLFARLGVYDVAHAVAMGYELGYLQIGKTQGIAYEKDPALWNLDTAPKTYSRSRMRLVAV